MRDEWQSNRAVTKVCVHAREFKGEIAVGNDFIFRVEFARLFTVRWGAADVQAIRMEFPL